MKIVRRTNADIINAFALTFQFVKVPVEAFEFRKKVCVRKIGIENTNVVMLIESSDKKVIGLTFTSVNKSDKNLEREFVRLIRNSKIPDSVYSPLQVDNINFVGRKIPLGSRCHWMGVNNVQCTYLGQMNWSIHRSLDDATEKINVQFKSIAGKKGKIISDTTVTVIFEGTETTARKIVYDFTGITSVLVGLSGGKTLTVYYVATSVRNKLVSCVMSHWNNDQINPSGLSPLLEEVMKLKN